MNRRKFIFAGAVAALPIATVVPSLALKSERWIPVEERLPDPGVDVFCIKRLPANTWPNYAKQVERVLRVDRVCPHAGNTPFDGKLWFVGDYHKRLTTHWKALPEFPEEDAKIV